MVEGARCLAVPAQPHEPRDQPERTRADSQQEDRRQERRQARRAGTGGSVDRRDDGRRLPHGGRLVRLRNR